MKLSGKGSVCLIGLLAGLCAPACATVQILSFTPSVKSPQAIGTSVTWTVTATDTNTGPLTFQFNVAAPKTPLIMVRDFNVGTLSSGVWTSLPFVWVPTLVEGVYQIQVVVKDFASGQTAMQTVKYQVSPLATGSMPVAVPTANPLVALFSAPSCAAGSSMRVNFQQQSLTTSATTTPYIPCHPPSTMTFEIAGMYPTTTYNMFAQTKTGGSVTNGPTVTFTTGALPTDITFPSATVLVPAGSHTDKADGLLLVNHIETGINVPYLSLATDLKGKTMWYYYQANNGTHFSLLTRPLLGGTLLTIEDGPAWNPQTQAQQTIRQIDLSGNIVRETNTGILQQELLAMGATNAQPCNTIAPPAQVGAACLGAFHHDFIQTLPNGGAAVFVDIEKIFPPGTQGDTSGLPVDIVGDMIIVLNAQWQPVWYFDAFQHDGGAPQLDINRAAVLGETCAIGQAGCPPMLLLGSGIAPKALDWLHGNSLYYWPTDSYNGASGDIIWSSRHQDWIMKIDYNNGTGAGDLLWRLGPCGDFAFNNITNDPWPWNSHQHEVAMENSGAGPMTVFDNGNTRVSPPTGPNSSTGCMKGTGKGNSRGMSLTYDEKALTVTPLLSDDLGVFSTAMGSTQLLSDGNYFFFAAIVLINIGTVDSYSIEILPTAGKTTGRQVLDVQDLEGYRGWLMPDLYSPPLT